MSRNFNSPAGYRETPVMNAWRWERRLGPGIHIPTRAPWRISPQITGLHPDRRSATLPLGSVVSCRDGRRRTISSFRKCRTRDNQGDGINSMTREIDQPPEFCRIGSTMTVLQNSASCCARTPWAAQTIERLGISNTAIASMPRMRAAPAPLWNQEFGCHGPIQDLDPVGVEKITAFLRQRYSLRKILDQRSLQLPSERGVGRCQRTLHMPVDFASACPPC